MSSGASRGCAWNEGGRYGTFFLSTLLPITPPTIPPTAAPIKPPFTLFRLVVAPMTAPAAAPMAASRCVCFTTVPPPDVEPDVPLVLLAVLVPLLDERVVLLLVDFE
jgi:hypothetical protein